MGFLSSNVVIRFDAIAAVVVVGASLINAITLGVGELGELQCDELESAVSALESDLETISITLLLLVDVLAAGFSCDGFTPVLEVILTLSNALSVVSDLLGIAGRGLGALALFGEDTSVIGVGLIVLEIISNILRPISLALRIFANLTSGVLISSLAASGSGTACAGSLLTFVLGSSDTGIVILAAVSLLLAGFETVVGVIQSYVYSILALQYGRGARV